MAKTFKTETIIVDTGIIYALADREDKWHNKAVAFVSTHTGRLVVPSLAMSEACYLLNTYLGQAAELAFVQSLINGELGTEQVTLADLMRATEILKSYADADIGIVDASLAAVAERLKITKVLTTDRRHFSMIKPAHCKWFELLP